MAQYIQYFLEISSKNIYLEMFMKVEKILFTSASHRVIQHIET